MPSNRVLENHPLPGGHARRYHYISLNVEAADPDAIAEEANTRAAQGYALFAAMPVQRGTRTDVVLVFARRLRRVRGAAVAKPTEGAPPVVGQDQQGRPILTSSEG